MAADRLVQFGVLRDQILTAKPIEAEGHRTFQSAAAVWRVLKAKNIFPASINVFTFGMHAQRSRLVYAKVFEPEAKVGVISWVPPNYTTRRWWHSSERATEMLRESLGFLFELLLNSGRTSNSPLSGTSQGSLSSIRLDARWVS
jgi:hypothetical protein